MIGTRGVPARYGGFETAIEEVGSRLAARGHEVIVYCRNPNQELRSHRGMRLVNLPALRRRALETISHAGMSVGHSVLRSRPDVAVVFNSANAPYLPILKAAGIPVAVHVDGLEWKRAKWAGAGAKYYRRAESWSVHWADAVIADAHGIVDHIRREYGVESTYIPYGADIIAPGAENLRKFGIAAREYHLVVARFEPENHVREIVRGYASSTARFPLVVVGSAPYADRYSDSVRAGFAGLLPWRSLGPERPERTLWKRALISAWTFGWRDQSFTPASSRSGCSGHGTRQHVQSRSHGRLRALLSFDRGCPDLCRGGREIG
jgi:glycosyltransferase involved in cell wall biosynthesis